MTSRLMHHDLPIRICKIIDPILMSVLFAGGWYMYYYQHLSVSLNKGGSILVVAAFFYIYAVFGRTYDAFKLSISRISELIYSHILALFLSDVIIYFVISILRAKLCNPLPLLIVFALQILFSVIWSFFSHRWYYKYFPAKKSIVVYDLRSGLEKLIEKYGYAKKFNVTDVLTISECLNDLSKLDETEVVFLSGIHSKDRNVILKYCINKDIQVYVIPRLGDIIMSGSKKMHMMHLPILRAERFVPVIEYAFIKRAFDIIASLIGIILLSPVMIVTAIAVRTDGGPALYKQDRLTKDGQVFKILKFRSMRVDAEKDGVARLSSGDKDDRITKVGSFIRKVRIDEIPQLFNILMGDMSVVGPRPERPEIAAQYEETLPEFKLRLQVKAGLTGYAQVYGQYNTTPYDKLSMDLMYIASAGVIQDLSICFATAKILFQKESTEGIEEGQTTAMGE